ncbi:MAG: DUF998 domain-containing protein [Actinobacteria bacterium]|uniref:Unannotated protein n=1 Tax=freshwater metagenome TaxID=449393 RepID=A0A6J6R5T7_9ZZZZ|nr:DUF998 domain-containing protein [Actinomycetota bacterium]
MSAVGGGPADRRVERAAAWLWLVRPAYVAIELAVLAAAHGYRVVDDTVSDLGARGCDPACSPWHPLMNAAFIVFGVLMAAGAVLLDAGWGAGWRERAVTALLVLSGLSSAAVGLTPVDTYPTLHVWAATPLFVAQPLALVLLGRLLRGAHPVAGRIVTATGVVTGLAAVAFVVLDSAPGITERLALWPVFGALALAGRCRLADARMT